MLYNIFKLIKKYKTDIKKILFIVSLAGIFAACGTTKVTVNRPDNGTYTEIKVTTNNPISTDVKPQTDLNYEH